MPVAREIYQEGLIMPPVKLASRGRISRDVMAILLANVRTPDEREGDLTAQIAANRVADARLRETVARYGRRRTLAYARALQDYTERVLRAAIREIPDGRYEFEDALDDDGFSDRPVKIRAAVTIRRDRATIDFTGSDPQVTGSVNANYAMTLSACLYAFRCLVGDDVLYNAGVSRPLTVIAPEGSIVNARRPAAVAGGNVETSQRITDVVLGALGKALPGSRAGRQPGHDEQRDARRHGPAHGPAVRVLRDAGRRHGRAARAARPQRRAHAHEQHAQHAGRGDRALPAGADPRSTRSARTAAAPARGGAATASCANTRCSPRRRSRCCPNGGAAGRTARAAASPGRRGRNTLIRADGREETLPGKIELQLRAGDRLRIETPGGGGFGEKAVTENWGCRNWERRVPQVPFSRSPVPSSPVRGR